MSDATTTERPTGQQSFSRLSAYAQCPRKFFHTYVEKRPRAPQGALIGGSAVHETIETSELEGWPWLDVERGNYYLGLEFTRRFLEGLEEAGAEKVVDDEGNVTEYTGVRWGGRKSKQFPGGEDHRWWLRMGHTMLKRYAAQRRYDVELGHVLTFENVELRVTANIGGVPVVGYVDGMLYVSEDGVRIIRDWKTGSSWPTPDQLATYAVLLKNGPGIEAWVGEFVMLRFNDNRVKQYDLRPLMPFIEEQFSGLEQQIAVSTQTGLWPHRPSTFCVSCTVLPFCEPGTALVNAMETAATR